MTAAAIENQAAASLARNDPEGIDAREVGESVGP